MSFNALVTGGAGFLGSHVAEELVAREMNVLVLDDLSGGNKGNIPSGAAFVEGSICDRELVGDLFKRYQFDFVYHLAAYAAENLSNHIKHYNYDNNLMGSINLIGESVKYKVKRFVFTSSIAVYGNNSLPFCEYQVPLPMDSYGISKWTIEQELRICREYFGLPYVIFRPHNIYGERQNIHDKYRNVIGIFIKQILAGRPMTIFGDGTQKRQFTYVKDITPIIAGSVFDTRFTDQVFNLGSDMEYQVKDLVEHIRYAFELEDPVSGNATSPVDYLEARHEVHTAAATHYKLDSLWPVDKTPLPEGIRKMVAWAIRHYRTNPDGATRQPEIEIERGLPQSWKPKA